MALKVNNQGNCDTNSGVGNYRTQGNLRGRRVDNPCNLTGPVLVMNVFLTTACIAASAVGNPRTTPDTMAIGALSTAGMFVITSLIDYCCQNSRD